MYTLFNIENANITFKVFFIGHVFLFISKNVW